MSKTRDDLYAALREELREDRPAFEQVQSVVEDAVASGEWSEYRAEAELAFVLSIFRPFEDRQVIH